MKYNVIDDIDEVDALERQEREDTERALYLSLEDSRRQSGPSRSRPQHLTRNLESIDNEIAAIERQVKDLQALLQELKARRQERLRELREEAQTPYARRLPAANIDYNGEFEWTDALNDKLKRVFRFDAFRSCQKSICNANMDGRDIVAIMPTGGGKSLGYQLPALLTPGCTLVISPLLALIADQVMHLHEAGVDAVMLTGATSREDRNNIFRRLHAMSNGIAGTPEVKLLYVTPEMLASSKQFKATIDKLYRVKKLARFVIDEAHCVSQQGHDFRPHYQKLSILRELWPEVPILALSATCPAAVLNDLFRTLGMRRPTHAQAIEETVIFSMSLYRKNLHYRVVPKSSSTADCIVQIRDYIYSNHMNETGIIYCLTKKDCQSVAEDLDRLSHGMIKTGVYHSDVADLQKEELHRRWRDGEVKVVCATIAFGLGIDKGDVRFVIHHSLSKSLDGFYQESGRAGRDGEDADCLLYYRTQDAMRVASLTCNDRGGQEKVLAMLAFASNLKECRKIQFARYFNKSSNLSLSFFQTEDEDASTPCGHCDNCRRPPNTLERQDAPARVAAWQLLRVAEEVHKLGADLTLAQLCECARGLGSSSTVATGKGKGKGKGRDKVTVDVHRVAGGAVELSSKYTEALCVKLLLDGYFTLSFHQTAYSVNVYLKPSALAARLTRLSKEQIERGDRDEVPAFECVFLKTPDRKVPVPSPGRPKPSKRNKVAGSPQSAIAPIASTRASTASTRASTMSTRASTMSTRASTMSTRAPTASTSTQTTGTQSTIRLRSDTPIGPTTGKYANRKRSIITLDSEEEEMLDLIDEDFDEEFDAEYGNGADEDEEEADDDEDEDEDWQTSLRSSRPRGGASHVEPPVKRRRKSAVARISPEEIIEVSD